MADQKYPYTTVPRKLRDLLSRIPKMGRPTKVTVSWLKAAGWTSSNDASIIPVLKFVGVLSADGAPTPLWDALRVQTKENKARVADAVRKAYAELFAIYPDAHRKDAEALRNFFRAHTTAGEQAQTKMVQTFQSLGEFADFDTPVPDSTPSGPADQVQPRESPGTRRATPTVDMLAGAGLTLNVNIQLQLPATSDGDVYEQLFAAMRKHLMGLASPE